MAVNILHEAEMRSGILAGARQLGELISPTFGPCGKSIVIRQSCGSPLVSSRGLHGLHALQLADPFENMGAQVLLNAASTVKEQAGDGTCTTILLARHILEKSLYNIASGADPVKLRKGIQGAAQLSCAAIRRLARPLSSGEELYNLTALSCRDEAVGRLAAEALQKTGPHGRVSVEESPELVPSLTVTEGMHYEKGFVNPGFLTQPARLSEELKDPFILVTDQSIRSSAELLPVLEAVCKTGRPLLIIADEVSGEALSLLILNKKNGKINSVVVHPPGYGDGRSQQLEDIAVFTGAFFLSETLGYSVKNATPEMLGSARTVRVDAHHTVILDGGGDQAAIKTHVEGLRTLLAKTDYSFEHQRLAERLAKFQGSTALIRAGAPSEPEMKDQKVQLENAVSTARAAWEEGIVPGGGVIYLNTLSPVRAYAKTLSGDSRTGAEILIDALRIPAWQLAVNGGISGDVALAALDKLPRGYGRNAVTGAYEDMIQAGIIDTAMGARLALQCASSAASVLLTTEAAVSQISLC